MKAKLKSSNYRHAFWRAVAKALGVYLVAWAIGSLIERHIVNPTDIESMTRTIWIFGGLALFISAIVIGYKIVFSELARAQFKPSELAKRLVASLVLAEVILLGLTASFDQFVSSNDARPMQPEDTASLAANIVGALFFLLLPYIAFKAMLYILARNRAERERTELFK